MSRILETLGCDRIITMDLHAMQIQGSVTSSIQWDDLQAKILALSYFRPKGEVNLLKPCIISPDAGGVVRAKSFQSKLIEFGYKNCTLAMIIK